MIECGLRGVRRGRRRIRRKRCGRSGVGYDIIELVLIECEEGGDEFVRG